jgi:arylamine N-acetyltransferase
MLETIKGDEASRLFLSNAGIALSGRGVAFLRDLALGFSEFPYENISKIIKSAATEVLSESIRLPAEVVVDHFERNFGGTCFSLTFLVERVLTALGFDCYKVMADMRSGKNVHCLVIVRDGVTKYMVDPGYALYEVIELPCGGNTSEAGQVTIEFPHAVVEVDRTGPDRYELWTADATGRKWRYAFRDAPVADDDFEKHWISSFTKPTLHNICLTMMTPRGHLYLRKDFFKFASRTTVSKSKLKGGVEAFICEHFGIDRRWTDLAQQVLEERRRGGWRR